MLDISFSFPTQHVRGHNVTAYPEIQLISLIVIATKLSHPFDDIPRLPVSESDPTVTKINWTTWASIMTEKSEPGLKRGQELNVKDTDVWNMDGKKIDDYLDWYQRTWVDDRIPKSASPFTHFIHRFTNTS
jgi:RNA polymerase I-specific transcription initiation factor RRN7